MHLVYTAHQEKHIKFETFLTYGWKLQGKTVQQLPVYEL